MSDGATFCCHGAARNVTGSKHLLTVNGQQILMDCGMFQGRREESHQRNMNLPFAPGELDHVLLSHGHFDHCGNLPSLVRGGFEGNIYATDASRDIANLIMMDSAHIMQKDFEYLKRQDRQAYEPIYAERHVLDTLSHFVTIGWGRRMPLGGDVSFEFYSSGHILGSSMIVVTWQTPEGERRLAFTGDLGRPGMPIIAAPDPLPPIDYLVMEGTYGNRLHDPIDNAMDQLAEVITDTAARGGKVIIPSFAVGRTQELVYFLHLLKDHNRIPDLDVYVDSPMAVSATSIFRVHQECYNEEVHQAFLDHHKNPFGFEGLHYTSHVSQSKLLNGRPDPMIIISSSGMCEAGRILHHLKNNITDSRNTVLIVGYMAENTLGRAIAERRDEVSIFGNKYPLHAQVKILNTFSAHADYEDLLAFARGLDLDRLRQVFLVHGEDDALNNLRQLLGANGLGNVVIPDEGQVFELS